MRRFKWPLVLAAIAIAVSACSGGDSQAAPTPGDLLDSTDSSIVEEGDAVSLDSLRRSSERTETTEEAEVPTEQDAEANEAVVTRETSNQTTTTVRATTTTARRTTTQLAPPTTKVATTVQVITTRPVATTAKPTTTVRPLRITGLSGSALRGVSSPLTRTLYYTVKGSCAAGRSVTVDLTVFYLGPGNDSTQRDTRKAAVCSSSGAFSISGSVTQLYGSASTYLMRATATSGAESQTIARSISPTEGVL